MTTGAKRRSRPTRASPSTGLVSDKEGNPLEGVVVSDGYSVVASDKKGVYQIVRDPNAKHVFISVPSGYEIPAQANFGSYQGAYQAANSVTGSSSNPTGQTSRLASSPKATSGSCSSGWATRSPTTTTIYIGSARKRYPT